MSVALKEIMDKMELLAPTCLAEDWDNVGLIIGDSKKEVNSILVALDPGLEVIAQAINKGVDLIISHHPILFSKTKKITNDTIDGIKVIQLIKNDIALYSAHTNLDQTQGGIEDTLAEMLGINDYQILEQKNIFNKQPTGYGRIGKIANKTTLHEFAQWVKEQLELESLQVIGNPNQIIEKVATACGSGSGQVELAKKNGADVLVTGDIKYHTANEAMEMGICLIDATHYGTERHVVKLLGNYLRKQFPSIIVFEDVTGENPMKTI